MTVRNILENNKEKILIVHYSCSDLLLKPIRISCVGIRKEESNFSRIFSLREFSEEEMLKRFWKIVEDNKDGYFVGWNIKNIAYGLIVLRERFETITGNKAPIIDTQRIIDLDKAIRREPSLKSQKLSLLEVAELNEYQTMNFIDGKDEIKKFEDDKFWELELSVDRKLKIIGEILLDFISEELKIIPTEIQKTGDESKINILFLSANPEDNPIKLRFDKEIREIQEKILNSEEKDKIEFCIKTAVRTRDFQSYIDEEKPDIVHFSGHGTDGYIILEDDAGNSKPVSAEVIARIFKVLENKTTIVVLNCCFSASSAEEISKTVDCVIGMDKEINDEPAIAFASGFYRALASKKDLKASFEWAVNQYLLEGGLNEDIPQLFMHSGLDASKTYIDKVRRRKIVLKREVAEQIAIEFLKNNAKASDIEVEGVSKIDDSWIITGSYSADLTNDLSWAYNFEINVNSKGEIISYNLNA